MLHPKRTCIIRIKNFSHSMPQSHFKIQFDIKLEKNKLNSTSTFKGGYSNFLYLTELTLSQTTNFGLSQTERVCRRQFQI